jgi:hypothetical protein
VLEIHDDADREQDHADHEAEQLAVTQRFPHQTVPNAVKRLGIRAAVYA